MVVVFLLACVALWRIDILHTTPPAQGVKCKARVLSVDNSNVFTIGLLRKGEQHVRLKVLSGPYKGREFNGTNIIRANMELDKVFEPGDLALVAIPYGVDENFTVIAQDHYRIGNSILLFSLFGLLLLVFAGITGFNALLSFVFSCLVIWKIVVPLSLKPGFSVHLPLLDRNLSLTPGEIVLLVTFGAVTLLCAVIIFLVAGMTRKGVTAFIGSILGVLASCVMAYVFTKLFRISGGMMPYAQTLLYSGYEFLSLPHIYIGAIFLSSSGAVMDLAMDVSAGMVEILQKRPDIDRRELIGSGLNIGRSVVGTMTTTLLLAYSGGYLTLMMTFAAQGIGPLDFINNPYVASEAVKTLVGSFGLVLVAPFTAFVGGFVITSEKKTRPAPASLPAAAPASLPAAVLPPDQVCNSSRFDRDCSDPRFYSDLVFFDSLVRPNQWSVHPQNQASMPPRDQDRDAPSGQPPANR